MGETEDGRKSKLEVRTRGLNPLRRSVGFQTSALTLAVAWLEQSALLMLCMQVRGMEKAPISAMVIWLAQRGPLA
jgi:hypothetical protein